MTESLLERDRGYGARGQDEVAEIVSREWRCEVRRTALFSYFDFEFIREGRVVAIGEVKSRRCTSDTYDEVYLTLDKWYRLLDISRSLDVKGFLLYNFEDSIRYIEVGRVDARNARVCGRSDRPEMVNDRSPKILVPVADMGVLGGRA